MFCRLHRLGLNQESTFKTLFAAVVACHPKELSHVGQFAFGVGIVQAHVTFAAAPENVIGSTQSDRGVDGIFDLNGHIGNHAKIGISGSAVHVARISKYIGRSPKQFYA